MPANGGIEAPTGLEPVECSSPSKLVNPWKSQAYLREVVAGRDGWGCFYCGEFPDAYHLDHVTPKSRGGSDGPANRVLACAPCNLDKGTMPGWRYVWLKLGGHPTPKPMPAAVANFGLPTQADFDVWIAWSRSLHEAAA